MVTQVRKLLQLETAMSSMWVTQADRAAITERIILGSVAGLGHLSTTAPPRNAAISDLVFVQSAVHGASHKSSSTFS